MDWKCSQHRHTPAEGTCSECGVYLCVACRKLHSPPLCLKCIRHNHTARMRVAVIILAILLVVFAVAYHTELGLPGIMKSLYTSPPFRGAESHSLFMPEEAASSSHLALSPLGRGISFTLFAYALVQTVMLVIIGLNSFGITSLNSLVYIPAGDKQFSPWLVFLARLSLIVAIVVFTFLYGHIILPLLFLFYLYELASSSLSMYKMQSQTPAYKTRVIPRSTTRRYKR